MNVEKKIFKIDPNFRVVALAEPPSSTSSGGVGSGGGSSQQQQVGSLAIQYNASSKWCQGFFADIFLSKSAISDFDRFLPTKKMSWIAVDGKIAELFL